MQSKNFIFLCVCMIQLILAKKTYENNDLEVIVDGIGMLWLNERHIEEKLDHKNVPSSQTNMMQYTKSTVRISR